MVEHVFDKSKRLNETSYKKYLDDLGILTEFYKGSCPSCSEVFKIKPMPFDRIDVMIKYPSIHCPYCGHYNYYNKFFTSDSPVIKLDTTRNCRCGLTYSVTGVTVICPNCVIFNSRQLFLEQVEKIKSSITVNNDWENLSDNLSKLVSQFDGYARATIRFQYFTSIIPSSVKSISFQNLEGANKNIQKEFGLILKDFVQPDEWNLIFKYFQRRHVIAHLLGVTDKDYIDKTGDATVRVGQRITLDQTELVSVLDISVKLALKIYGHLAS
jgi:hypothetical protein